MGKYVIMQDMRQKACYKNINARLLYMHVAMGADICTYTYATSLRRLAAELDMTLDAVRHALKLLTRDELLEVAAPQSATQGAPQGAPQTEPKKTPHVTILKIKKSGTPNGTPNNTPNTTPNPTPSTTESPTDKNNKNKNNLPTHDVGAPARELASQLAGVLELPPAAALTYTEDFLKRQSIKGKAWLSDGDRLAHLVSWTEKRLQSPSAPRRTARQSDEAARQAEYQRTREELEARDELDKLRDRWAQLTNWRKDFAERGDSDNVIAIDEELATIRKKVATLKKAAS